MKKRVISLLVALIIVLISATPVCATDATVTDTPNVIYYSDGSYIIISDVVVTDGAITRTSYLRFASKDVTYYNSDDEIEWEYVLSATFSYEPGVSSVCREASYDQTIYDDKWSFSDGEAYADDATAYGIGTYEKTVLFITVDTVGVDVSITCDTYGNIS